MAKSIFILFGVLAMAFASPTPRPLKQKTTSVAASDSSIEFIQEVKATSNSNNDNKEKTDTLVCSNEAFAGYVIIFNFFYRHPPSQAHREALTSHPPHLLRSYPSSVLPKKTLTVGVLPQPFPWQTQRSHQSTMSIRPLRRRATQKSKLTEMKTEARYKLHWTKLWPFHRKLILSQNDVFQTYIESFLRTFSLFAFFQQLSGLREEMLSKVKRRCPDLEITLKPGDPCHSMFKVSLFKSLKT